MAMIREGRGSGRHNQNMLGGEVTKIIAGLGRNEQNSINFGKR